MATIASYIQRGTRAAQPAATAVSIGTLYSVTDESNLVERSNGTAWQQFAPSGGGTVTNTGTLTANRLLKGNGGTDLTVGDLTGDVTTSATMATTLANSGVSAGSYGSAIVTFDAKGRATAAVQNYLQYRDEQAQNTAGGTFTTGAWRTRVLNTEVSDVGGHGSLASNQITLAAGTYLIDATAPAFNTQRHQLRLQNVTDATTILIGQSDWAFEGVSGVQTAAQLRGIFTVAASKALELQHQSQRTQATNGFGEAANFTTEVYAVVELWKIG